MKGAPLPPLEEGKPLRRGLRGGLKGDLEGGASREA